MQNYIFQVLKIVFRKKLVLIQSSGITQLSPVITKFTKMPEILAFNDITTNALESKKRK